MAPRWGLVTRQKSHVLKLEIFSAACPPFSRKGRKAANGIIMFNHDYVMESL